VKSGEVPQEPNALLAGVRKATYAVDESGHYVSVASSGWSAEEAVTRAAVEEYRRLAREAFDRAARGETSPLEFHMYDRRMDEPMLAQSAGVWRWRLRRHLRVRGFARLSPAWLARYADALGIGVDALRTLPERAA
jgi:hypothetical protein